MLIALACLAVSLVTVSTELDTDGSSSEVTRASVGCWIFCAPLPPESSVQKWKKQAQVQKKSTLPRQSDLARWKRHKGRIQRRKKRKVLQDDIQIANHSKIGAPDAPTPPLKWNKVSRKRLLRTALGQARLLRRRIKLLKAGKSTKELDKMIRRKSLWHKATQHWDHVASQVGPKHKKSVKTIKALMSQLKQASAATASATVLTKKALKLKTESQHAKVKVKAVVSAAKPLLQKAGHAKAAHQWQKRNLKYLKRRLKRARKEKDDVQKAKKKQDLEEGEMAARVQEMFGQFGAQVYTNQPGRPTGWQGRGYRGQLAKEGLELIGSYVKSKSAYIAAQKKTARQTAKLKSMMQSLKRMQHEGEDNGV